MVFVSLVQRYCAARLPWAHSRLVTSNSPTYSLEICHMMFSRAGRAWRRVVSQRSLRITLSRSWKIPPKYLHSSWPASFGSWRSAALSITACVVSLAFFTVQDCSLIPHLARPMSFSAELAQITLQRFLVVPVLVPGPARNDVTIMLQKARKSVRLKVSASKTTSLWQPSLTASHHHSELEIPARPQRGASHEELRSVDCRGGPVQGGASLLPSTEIKLLTPPSL